MKPKKWDDRKSITLTRCVVAAFIAAAIAMTVCGPWLVRDLIERRQLSAAPVPAYSVLLVTGYLCAVLAFWMLYNLYRFLRRLEGGAVFVPENVTALRRISWCCVGAAVLCLPAGITVYLPFLFLGVAAAFMALLVRVIKNAFEQAVKMKNELDYTI